MVSISAPEFFHDMLGEYAAVRPDEPLDVDVR